MAIGTLNSTLGDVAGELLKKIYGPALRNELSTAAPAVKYFKKIGPGDVNWTKEGTGLTEGLLLGRNESFAALPELGHLPDSNFPLVKQMTIPMRYQYYSIHMSHQMMEGAAKGDTAFAEPLKLQMDGVTMGARSHYARMIWGDGRGAIAQVNGAAAIGATTIVVDNPALDVGTIGGTKFIRPKMLLAIFDPTDTTLLGMLTVTATASTGLSFTVAPTTFAVPDNSIIYHGSISTGTSATLDTSRNNECMGLKGIVNDAVGFQTYFGIDRSVFPQMGSTVLDGSGGLSEDLMQRAFDAIQVLGDDQEGHVKNVKIFCEHGVRRAYMSLNQSLRRFTGEFDLKRDGASAAVQNVTNLSFGMFEVIADYNAPYGQMVIFDSRGAKMVEQKSDWLDKTGAIWREVGSPRVDAYVADYTIWANLYHVSPKSSVRITGIPNNVIFIKRY